MNKDVEEQRVLTSITQVQSTERDRENVRIRQEIADRQTQEYAEAERLALAALGPDWTPWMKLVVVDSDYHTTGNFEPVVTLYKVYQGERRLTENTVYLRQMPDGQIRQARDYETLVGELLRKQIQNGSGQHPSPASLLTPHARTPSAAGPRRASVAGVTTDGSGHHRCGRKARR